VEIEEQREKDEGGPSKEKFWFNKEREVNLKIEEEPQKKRGWSGLGISIWRGDTERGRENKKGRARVMDELT